MEHVLKLQVPDDLYGSLLKKAKETGSTPEGVALQSLTRELAPPRAKVGREAGDEALIALAGTFYCEIDDVADRHDYYIGRQLMRDLRPDEDG